MYSNELKKYKCVVNICDDDSNDDADDDERLLVIRSMQNKKL